MLKHTSFYFMRHGQTDWNVERRIMGHQPVSLNATGKEQALRARKLLARLPITHILHSPLTRAHETMELATMHLSLPKIACTELSERNFGEWEGQTKFTTGSITLARETPAYGESREEFFERVAHGVNQLLHQYEGPVLLISHSGVYRALCNGIGLDEELAAIGNAHIAHFVPPSEETNFVWDVRTIK